MMAILVAAPWPSAVRTCKGFVMRPKYTTQIRNLRPSSLVWFAPPCCSWVWVPGAQESSACLQGLGEVYMPDARSRGSSGRKKSRPQGFANRYFKVRLANVFARRMAYVHLG